MRFKSAEGVRKVRERSMKNFFHRAAAAAISSISTTPKLC